MNASTFFSPVNCAKTDWASGATWGAYFERGESSIGTDEVGVVALGETKSQPAEIEGSFVLMRFCYQATQEFTIDLNWSSPAGGGIWQVTALTLEGGIPVKSGAASGSGSETITLPASSFGRVQGSINGDGAVSLSFS